MTIRIVLLLFLVAAGPAAAQPLMLSPSTGQFPADVVSACPGLKTYAGDLSAVSAGKTGLRGFDGGTEYSFIVNANPKTIPGSIRSRVAQHNCGIVVNDERSCMFIAKRACHSLCDGTWRKNDEQSLGRMLPMKEAGCAAIPK